MENQKPQNFWVVLDCEMAGLELEYSLLTVHFMIINDKFEKVDELSLFVKPNDGKYIIDAQAMAINRIDLVKHNAIAIPYKEAGTKLFNWLRGWSDDGKIKLTPIGHGVIGDIRFITHYLIGRLSWEKFVSYRVLDTSSTCQFLKTCGLFPDDVSGSLVSLAEYFGVKVDESETHTAKYDVTLTLEVFKSLRKILVK